MDRGSIILELSRSLAIPCTREDILIITMEDITMEDIIMDDVTMEGMQIIIRTTTTSVMVMEAMATRTVPLRHRRISVISPISSARRHDTMPLIARRSSREMETAMETQQPRSPILSLMPKWTTSMWRTSMISHRLWLVSFY